MVGNQLEQEIIALYNRDITALYSINEIASKLGKAYPYINKKVTSLIKEGILKKTIIGRSYLCSINLNNDKAVWLLILNEITQVQNSVTGHAAELISRVKELRTVVTLHLALKIGKRLIFVLENEKDSKILEKSARINSFKVEIYSEKEFLELLLQDKSILTEHLIVHGYEKFYHYLQEVEPQLRIKFSRLLS